MNNKMKIIICLFFCTTCLIGCDNKIYDKENIYDTNLIGTFSRDVQGWIGEDKNDTYQDKEEYVFDDETYTYYAYNSINAPKGYNKDGSYSVSKINSDIDKIILNEDEIIYKYKNMLGGYIPVSNIPEEKTFDLTIHDAYEDCDSDYDGIIFTEDGKIYISINVNDFDPDENHLKYDYIRKNNIIYFNAEGFDIWQIMYYVVDGGLFTPSVYKVEE